MSDTDPIRTAIRLHRFGLSGHCHRVELMLSLLGLPAERVDVDLAAGEHRTPEFLARNPMGQVPVVEIGGLTLADSNAILVYLARSYDPQGRWLPADARGQAEVQRWLSLAAGPLAYGPAAARAARLFGKPSDPQHAQIARRLFDMMDGHLGERDWLAASHPTVADVAMYSYTARAPEGDIALAPWPRIEAWIDRMEALPGFLPMPVAPTPAGD